MMLREISIIATPRVVVSVAVLLLLLIASSCLLLSRPHRGDILATWVTANETFKVRVIEYDEKGAAVTGTYYVFESAGMGSDDWHEIMTFRHDDRPGIPREQVRFVDDRVGYLFMGWMYAVTTDAGVTWSVRDITKELSDYKPNKYGVIQDMRIAPDGIGTIVLDTTRYPSEPGRVPELRTRDYGRHWTAP